MPIKLKLLMEVFAISSGRSWSRWNPKKQTVMLLVKLIKWKKPAIDFFFFYISLGKKEMVITNCCTLSTSQKHFFLPSVQKSWHNSISFHINCEIVLLWFLAFFLVRVFFSLFAHLGSCLTGKIILILLSLTKACT